MSLVREFYRLVWSDAIAKETIESGDDPKKPTFQVEIAVTEDNISLLTEVDQQSVARLLDPIQLTVGITAKFLRDSNSTPELGVFFNHYDPLRSQLFDTISRNEFYIGDIDYDSKSNVNQQGEPKQVTALKLIADLEQILTETQDYPAGSSRIYFANETLEIPKNFDFSVYDDGVIDRITSQETVALFNTFKDWFNSNTGENHLAQKKSIIKLQLFKLLSEIPAKQRSVTLVSSIKSLSEQSTKSYALYMEEFSYSKFTQKLEDQATEYYGKISKAVLDVKNQIISLPISFVVLNVVKEKAGSSIYIFGGMIVFCAILTMLLRQQQKYLNDLETEVNGFLDSSAGAGLSDAVAETRTNLNERIDSQRRYIYIFYLIVALAFIVAVHQYDNSLIDNVLYLLGSILDCISSFVSGLIIYLF